MKPSRIGVRSNSSQKLSRPALWLGTAPPAVALVAGRYDLGTGRAVWRVVRWAARTRMENALTSLLIVCGMIFLIGRGLAWVVNKLARRRLLNTAIFGLICTLPWSLAPIYVLVTDTSGKLLRLSPQAQGEMVGMFVTPSLIVFALGIWLAARESKRAKSADAA